MPTIGVPSFRVSACGCATSLWARTRHGNRDRVAEGDEEGVCVGPHRRLKDIAILEDDEKEKMELSDDVDEPAGLRDFGR